jgi:hypothetical protein
MKTLADITAVHRFQVLEHLEAEAQVPVLGGLQAQGDLFVIPQAAAGRQAAGGMVVPPAGIAVIPAVGSSHEHRLFAGTPGTAWWTPAFGSGQDLGMLKCTEPAYLLHPEHGATGIAPGLYLLRRQREQGEGERVVAD